MMTEVDRRGQVSDKSLVETILLCAGRSMTEAQLAEKLPALVQVRQALEELQLDYADRSIQLIEVNEQTWAIRTRPEHSQLARTLGRKHLRLSRAAIETLYVIGYFQPVTRGEIDRIRGVKSSRSILDVLIFNDWVIPSGRRAGPGNPLTFITTHQFLETFNFKSIDDLPDIARIREEGLLNRDLGIDLPEGQSDDEG